MAATVAKNTTFMMLASVGQKIISLTYFTILARELGAEKLGLYTAALALTTIFVIFVDLGFTNVFIREASKDKSKVQELLSNVLFVKVFFGIATYIALVVTVQLLGFEPDFAKLVYLSGITMLLDSIHLTIYGALRAFSTLRYEAYSLVGAQLLTLILGLSFLYLGFSIIYLILAFTITSALNVLYAAYVARVKYNLVLRARCNKALIRNVSIIAIPFALAAIFGRMYSYIDVILLKKLAGAAEVGYYSTPSKITFAFQFIPLALIAALYPKFSEYYAHNKKMLAHSFEQSLKFLFAIALPITVGIYLLADRIIILVFTELYASSILPLKILIVSLTFSFISFPIGAFLNACSRQRAQTIITGVVLAFNVIANLIFIPRLGALGAAYSALGSNVLLGLLGYILIPRVTSISHGFIVRNVLLLLMCACVMGFVVWWSSMYVHLVGSIMLGVCTYTAMLFLVRALTVREVKELITMVRG